MKSKKLKYRAHSVKLSNISGNFQEYDISEEQFSNFPIDKMLKYIVHNNKNVNDFNEYFYNDLYRLKKNTDTQNYIITSKRRSKSKKH